MKRFIFYLLLGTVFSFSFETAFAEEPSVWEKTKGVANDTWEGTKNVTSDVWDGAKKVTGDVWDGAKNVAGDVKDGITGDGTPDTEPQPHTDTNMEHHTEHNHSDGTSE